MAAPVSICLTTWNRAAELPATLDSLLSQTYGDFELIIADDASEDGTERICRQYIARDSRLRYWRNPQNLGMPGNLNVALGLASGRFIANLHDGDVFHPQLIARWVGALEQNPSAAFVFNAYETVDSRGRRSIARCPFGPCVPGAAIARLYFETMTSCVWGTVMARAEAYRAAGGFDPAFGFISDVDMWLRLARTADVAYVDEPLILLGPRPAEHPFRWQVWRSVFWSLDIYVRHLQAYALTNPEFVKAYFCRYGLLKRRLLVATLAWCVRHRRWDRMREGLSVLADADDPMLRQTFGRLGKRRWQPDWYSKTLWASTILPARPPEDRRLCNDAS